MYCAYFSSLPNRPQFEQFNLTRYFVNTIYYQNQLFYAINACFTSNIFNELRNILYVVESDDDGVLFVVSRIGVSDYYTW